jgi:hypothetical protein
MSVRVLVNLLAPFVREVLGLSELRITQFSVGSVRFRKDWHGSARVFVVADVGVLPEEYMVPFTVDFRVNHPKQLASASADELHELTKQLERLGYGVLSLVVMLDDGAQLEVINTQFRQPV